MIEAVQSLTEADTEERDALVERLLGATIGAFDMLAVHFGNALGLYRALAEQALTSPELAAIAGADERYMREWLEHQAVAGIVAVDDPAAPAQARRFSLPAAYHEVLVDRDSPNFVAPLGTMLAGVVRPLPAVLEAFRHGGGVAYSEYGAEFRAGQAAINRVTFLQEVGSKWLPAIPDVHARLLADPPARIADIGCGGGWSSIGLAQAYPNVGVDGFDLDEPSIALARKNARAAGLNGRLQFHVRDAADPALAGAYDLVTAFECVHDMSDPVGALATMKRLAGDEGTVLVVDERVADHFAPNGGEVERLMYGWSVFHCLPVGRADEPSVATGTVMRTGTLRTYAQQAGFADVAVLPIDNYFFRVYRLVP